MLSPSSNHLACEYFLYLNRVALIKMPVRTFNTKITKKLTGINRVLEKVLVIKTCSGLLIYLKNISYIVSKDINW